MGMLYQPFLFFSKIYLHMIIVTVSDSATEQNINVTFFKTLEENYRDDFYFLNVGKETSNEPRPEIFVPFGTLHTLDKLSFWANKEEDIVQVLDKKLKLIDEEIELISKYISDFEESSAKAIAEANEPMDDVSKIIAASPVLAHMMTDRYATYIQGLKNLLESSEYKETEDDSNRILEIDAYKTYTLWPSADDLLVSHLAILNIQQSHHARPEQIFRGIRYDSTFGGQFRAIHCVQMGMYALEHGYYADAVDWLELGFLILRDDESDDSFPKDLVVNLINMAVQEHNTAVVRKEQDYNAAFRTFYDSTYPGQPAETRGYSNLYYYQQYGKKYKESQSADLNMFALCKNEEFHPIELKSKLKCYRYHGGHLYYLINPLNAEELSQSPPVVQYYNVLTESMMQGLMDARGELYLSTVADHNYQDKTYSLSSRSSAGGVVPWEYSNEVWNLTNRLTGLVGMERTQTVEYVYGRVYWHHYDAYYAAPFDTPNAKLPETEDRIATVLYYIDTPVAGGNTPFVDAGVVAYPVRGSAVFWLNLFRNGTARTDTLHGACPVIHGHKTILNQWISYGSNFLTLPCTLNQFE